MDVNHFRTLFPVAKSASEAVASNPDIREVALGMYETFIAPGAKAEINVSQELR